MPTTNTGTAAVVQIVPRRTVLFWAHSGTGTGFTVRIFEGVQRFEMFAANSTHEYKLIRDFFVEFHEQLQVMVFGREQQDLALIGEHFTATQFSNFTELLIALAENLEPLETVRLSVDELQVHIDSVRRDGATFFQFP